MLNLLALITALAAPPGLPHSTFTLDNGLVVVVHEDHRLPLVAVNLDYRVGSADEPAGRTGFAHLFEHLMFMGTAAVPRGQFDALMESEGAWNNAWTSNDRTDYYEVGPSHALPLLLWLEADRMTGLGKAIDQEKLDLQRDVVRNERRQSTENTPYGISWLTLPPLVYPKGHPYHHSVIGSHADLQAATVGDVQDFFARWYVPRNASLVVAGDVDPAEVERLVRQYFGDIPAGEAPRAQRTAPMEPGLPAESRKVVEDRVDQARVILVWRTPAVFQDGDAGLDVLASAMADGKSSHLHQALVYGEAVAQDVYASQWSANLESQFVIWATGRDGISADDLEAKLLAAVETAIANITDDDVARARAGIRKAFIEKIESVRGRAAVLNRYLSVLGRPDFLAEDEARYSGIKTVDVAAVAQRWLTPERRAVLHIVPAKPAPTAGEGEAAK